MSELKQLTNVIRKEMELRSLLEEAVYVWPQFDWNMDLPPGRQSAGCCRADS